ncbi:MAG: biotin/lipoyl-binding protein, partial [Fimbriimonadaceae bacterium]|nr:biotin/lipoyl-binding protein [Alphaproteobacteria bacterium]
MITHDEIEFANDVHSALESRSPRATWFLLSAIFLLLGVVFFWAYFAVLEEVTSGSGRVIPSSQIQILQTLEGGIVRQILMREGDRVEKDQVLLQIDDTGFSSRLGELNQRRWALLAEMARLRAEANDAEKVNFGDEMPERAQPYFESEIQAFLARRLRLEQELSILHQQLEQKR